MACGSHFPGNFVLLLICSKLLAGSTGTDGLSGALSIEELEEHARALQLEIAVSDAARADMRDGLRVKHAKEDFGKPYEHARSSLLSLNGSAVMGTDASGVLQSDKACSVGWPMSPEKGAAKVL